MSDLPTHDDDGRVVLKLYENSVWECPECGTQMAAEMGDPLSGLRLRCVDCDESMEQLSDDDVAHWRDVNPDAYRHLQDS